MCSFSTEKPPWYGCHPCNQCLRIFCGLSGFVFRNALFDAGSVASSAGERPLRVRHAGRPAAAGRAIFLRRATPAAQHRLPRNSDDLLPPSHGDGCAGVVAQCFRCERVAAYVDPSRNIRSRSPVYGRMGRGLHLSTIALGERLNDTHERGWLCRHVRRAPLKGFFLYRMSGLVRVCSSDLAPIKL